DLLAAPIIQRVERRLAVEARIDAITGERRCTAGRRTRDTHMRRADRTRRVLAGVATVPRHLARSGLWLTHRRGGAEIAEANERGRLSLFQFDVLTRFDRDEPQHD